METAQVFKIILFAGIFLGLFLVAYEDGVPFSFFKKIRCRFGLHKRKIKFGNYRIRKYYCQWCNKPRKHPSLKTIDGGKKGWDNVFRF